MDWLIGVAISWEEEARDFYLALSRSFPDHPDIETFWRSMAADEAEHATILRDIRAGLDEPSASREVDAETRDMVRRTEALLGSARDARLDTLEDAYELAHQLEESEILSVFRLIMHEGVKDDERRSLLTMQLGQHVENLGEFGQSVDRRVRQAIRLRAAR